MFTLISTSANQSISLREGDRNQCAPRKHVFEHLISLKLYALRRDIPWTPTAKLINYEILGSDLSLHWVFYQDNTVGNKIYENFQTSNNKKI